MLRDITIGQYYPVESKIHDLDPRVKLIAVLVYLISLFLFNGFAGYAVVALFLVLPPSIICFLRGAMFYFSGEWQRYLLSL